jgi:SAM-dependent methyltransferase
MIRTHFQPDFRPKTSLDFGCGVGRVLLPLANESEKAVGVDISETMLLTARRNALDQNVKNVEFVRSDDELSELSSGYDFLHSVIVFQHIPPTRGIVILSRLLDRLHAGGYFWLHLTFAKDRRFLDNAIRHVEVYRMDVASIALLQERPADESALISMYDYDLNQVFWTLMKTGIDSIHMHFTDHGGCYGIVLCGRRR